MKLETTAINTSSGQNFQEYLSLLGGEEKARRNFPAHYAATRQDPLKAMNVSPMSFRILSAGTIQNDRDNIYVSAVIVTDNPTADAFCSLMMVAQTKSGKREVARATGLQCANNHAAATLKIPAKDRKDCELLLYGADLSTSRVACCTVDLMKYGTDDDLKASFTVDAPVKKTDPAKTGPDIVVSFKGYDAKDCRDYYYDYYNGPFQLPGKGKIEISRGSSSVEFVRCEDVFLTVADGGGVLKQHNLAAYLFTLNKNVLSWNTGSNYEKWGFNVEDLIDRSSYLYYALTFNMILSLSPEEIFTFTVTNRPEFPEIDLTKKIPNIKAYRDCVGEGTLVTLADGKTQTPIEQIKPGQLVSDGKGGAAKVTNVWKTTGVSDMLRVTAEKPLLISEHHRIHSETGPQSAVKLGGSVNMLKADSGTAYNLELDGAETFVANGITVEGITEAGMSYSRDKVRETLADEYKKDFDNLSEI